MQRLQKYLIIAAALSVFFAAACGGPDAAEVSGEPAGEAPGTEGGAGGEEPAAGQMGTDSAGMTREDIEAAAAEEPGPLQVSLSMDEDVIPIVVESFAEKYPDIETESVEVTGSEDERVLLEVQSGVSELDIMHISSDSYTDYLPYLEQVDLLAMVDEGALDMPTDMINPDEPYVMAAGSTISGIAWNPNLIEADLVPETYEDFLDPALKGRFLVDLEPTALAALWPEKGEEWIRQYSRDIAAQEPIWVRGTTRSLTAIAAGEYDMLFVGHYHSARRAEEENDDNLDVRLLEPVPVRLSEIQGIRAGSENVNSAILFLEHLASPEVQSAIDEADPFQSSVYAEGSMVAEATDGLETSVVTWDQMEQVPDRLQVILEEWGFPTAVLEG